MNNQRLELVGKSVGAAILIALGDFALLKLGNPIGPVIFAFGLLGVCYMGQNLFTGKCGFFIQDKMKLSHLMIILAVNLIAGYLVGVVFSLIDPEVFANAVAKVGTWDIFTWNAAMIFFIKSIFCGIIMYIAVLMYKKGTPLGIIFGVPLFIFCGFQHCIANVITMGVAQAFSWSLLICVLGNFVGSLLMWVVSRDLMKKPVGLENAKVEIVDKIVKKSGKNGRKNR